MKMKAILCVLAGLLWATGSDARIAQTNQGGTAGIPTFTVGSGGAYTDINAAVAAICAGSQGAVTGGCPGGSQVKNIIFQVTAAGLTTATLQTIDGWNAGSFTTLLEPDASGGFRAYLNAHPTSPLYFNTAYGGFILQTANNDGLYVNVNNFTMFGIQLMQGSGSGGNKGLYIGTSASVVTIDSNIIVASGTTHTNPDVFFAASSGAALAKNNVIFGLDNIDSLTLTSNSNINAYYNTFVMPSSISNQGAGMLIASNNPVTVKNNMALGFGSCGSGGPGGNNTGEGYIFNGGGTPQITAANNVTCMPDFVNNGAPPPPAFGGSGYLFQLDGQVGAVLTTEINGSYDARLATTSVKAHGTAIPGAGGITTDILGRTRNPYLDDAGAYSIGGITPANLSGGTQYIITSGTSWTIQSACIGPHNMIEAIGAGGPGATGVVASTWQSYSQGGGGAEYAAIYNYPFAPTGANSPGNTIAVSIPGASAPGTNGGNTTFGSVLIAVGGVAGTNTSSGNAAGGMGGTGVVLHDGGRSGTAFGQYASTGGGGSGGRNGPGAPGGDSTGSGFFFGTGGGGGADGGMPGLAGSATGQYVGGNGGAGTEGTAGTNGASSGAAAGTGGALAGGGGGVGTTGAYGLAGGNGGAGTEYAGSGPGAGGGGGGLGSGPGGTGGGYGGGGAGSGGISPSGTAQPGGLGGPGVLVVTCAP